MPARLHFFRERALVLTRTADSGWHAHRALQAMVALDKSFSVEREGGAASERRFAAFAPMEGHRIRGGDTLIAYLFFDVGPRAWQAWRDAGGEARAPEPALLDALRVLARPGHEADVGAVEALAARWCAECWPGLAVQAPADPRLKRALEALEAEPLAPWTHRSLAERAHLSPSRFQVLFREATGLPVRNYLLWRRLLEATARLQAGEGVTAAAHATGFADAAHLSRSFRRIIGAAPSSLLPGR
ncbi:helix-turn-helix transcriptional regulator [Silanimonas sp.]|jgi:AraC-like DNA-binding protein|uniref:helix-turn-helix transcriptional regulator n=1 Tax=Silanimonas sp. TaxID=1929290 RepID=UPI0037C7E6E8